MDVIYTDKNRLELGCLHNFEVDFDATSKKDFEIKLSINSRELAGQSWWYIVGTEYGGRVDKVTVDTTTDQIICTGRNFRGILLSKIVEPPPGEDYRVLSGTIHDIVYKLICAANLQDLYTVEGDDNIVVQYRFYRYVTVYDAIMTLTRRYGLVPAFKVGDDGKVHITFAPPTDYSNENEYTQDNKLFRITKVYNGVNHLICLGKGDLKDRTVVHLFADSSGSISQTQTLVGVDEITATYENTNADDADVLRDEGVARFKELQESDSFEVTVPEIDLKIGDIVGGVERITGAYVASEITNAIVKIDDDSISVDFKVGTDDTSSGGVPQAGTSTAGVYGMEVDENSNLYIYFEDGVTTPAFEYDAETGNLYVIGSTRQYEYDTVTGNLYEMR